MKNYNELDGAILMMLADKPMNWLSIHYAVSALPVVDGKWRVTDRRLQALRKEGLIAPDRFGGKSVWRLA